MRNDNSIPVQTMEHSQVTTNPYYQQETTSEMMGEAFNALYGPSYQEQRHYSEMQQVESSSGCHSCCTSVQQLLQEVAQLKGEMERLKRKRKPSQSISQSEECEEEITNTYNGKTKEYLQDIVDTTSSLTGGVKRLFLELFTTEEICSQSVMGRYTNKKHAKKTGLDERRRNLMEELLMKKFSASLMEVRNKMRDRLKILKRNHSHIQEIVEPES